VTNDPPQVISRHIKRRNRQSIPPMLAHAGCTTGPVGTPGGRNQKEKYPLTSRYMVELMGIEPTTSCLQRKKIAVSQQPKPAISAGQEG